MVPIHYFLALFVILASLMGCTQKVPPGSSQTISSNNTTTLVDVAVEPLPEPTQSINHDDVNVVKPSEAPVPSTLELSQPNGAHDWKLVLKGEDAEKLYNVMKIKPTDTDPAHRELDTLVKGGKHLECYRKNKSQAQCELIFKGDSGDLKILNRKFDELSPEDDRKEGYQSKSGLLEVFAASISEGGKLMISGESAQKVFDGLTDSKKVRTSDLAAGGDFALGKQKKGTHVDCYQQFKVAKPSDALYSCNFWFLNSTTGEFETIK